MKISSVLMNFRGALLSILPLIESANWGSAQDVVNGDGAILWHGEYSAYGQLMAERGEAVNRPQFGYAGMMKHYASGLNLTRFRAYHPEKGRWLSADPIGFAGGRNLYGYVSGNPINKFGLFGLATLCEALNDPVLNNTDNPFTKGFDLKLTFAALFNQDYAFGSEPIPTGGHGMRNADFTGPNGSDYDIQYVQVGWWLTKTYTEFGANTFFTGWGTLMNALGESAYFDPNGFTNNYRGFRLGVNGANKYNNFSDFVSNLCRKTNKECSK